MAALGLDDFVAQATGTPFVWGGDDCALWVADWGRQLTGQDGAAPWRGRYSTRIGCLRLLRREGGIRSVVERGALAVGMIEVEKPLRGDVGLVEVETPKGRDLVAGICLGDGFWALRAVRGVLVAQARATAFWGVR